MLVILDIAAALLALATIRRLLENSKIRLNRHVPLPPGPKGWPIIGNIFDMPRKTDWVIYHQWGKKYGSDIMYMKVLRTSMIVINSVDIALELLERRSAIYSERIHSVVLDDFLQTYDWVIGFMPYGLQWRTFRKTLHQEFHPSAAKRFCDTQEHVARSLLKGLLSAKQGWAKDVRQMAVHSILTIAYGIDIQSAEDPLVIIAESAMEGINAAGIPGEFYVEFIPQMKYIPNWFPGASFKRKLELWRHDLADFLDVPFKIAIDKIKQNSFIPSYVSYSLESLEADDSKDSSSEKAISMDVIKRVAAAMFVGKSRYHLQIAAAWDILHDRFSLAGADTTVPVLKTFVLCMLKNPEVQKRAHAELNNVLGSTRLPQFSHEQQLPYITAILMEVLRWHPPVPLSIPHVVVEDDVFKNYLIPKDSIILPNCWAMLRDPRRYPDPFVFKPERFLTPEGSLNKLVCNPATIMFGFGRRICPGRYLAMNSVWITIASILASFTIELDGPLDQLPSDPDGYTTGIVSSPQPFGARFVPRSLEIAGLINEIK